MEYCQNKKQSQIFCITAWVRKSQTELYILKLIQIESKIKKNKTQ